MRRFIVAVLVGFAVAAAGFLYWRQYVQRSERPSELEQATVYLGWLYSGAYAGEALAARQFDEQFGLQITLQQGGIGLDPLRLIADETFGIAASDEVLKAIANNGAPLAIVGVLNDDAPAAFAALASSGIRSPQDFVGRRVGILPFGSTRLIYNALLTATKVPRSQITEVPVSPDLRPFAAGTTHDVQPVYVYDEPVTLDQQGVKYNLILPKDYGVAFKGPVYFTTLATLERNPGLVSRFLSAMALGWRAAERSPETAISALKSLAPSIDAARELEVLRRALPYYFSPSRKLFDSDPESWQQMLQTLLDGGIINRPLAAHEFLYLDLARVVSLNRQP